MLTFWIGIVVGWAVTGTVDYFVTRRAVARAYAAGVDEGTASTLRQVAGW